MLYLIQYLFCMLVLGRKPHQHVFGPWFVKEKFVVKYFLNESHCMRHRGRISIMRLCECGEYQVKQYETSDFLSENESDAACLVLQTKLLELNTAK